MIETSRRSFLFGIGAVVAAASVGLPEAVTQVPYENLAGSYRAYFDIGVIRYFHPSRRDSYSACAINVCRNETKIVDFRLTPHFWDMRWVATPGSEIIIPDKYYLKLDTIGDARDLQIYLLYADDKRRLYNECHTFDENGQRIKFENIPMMAESI